MKLIYRPEIDGLRGIAVFSVILYHSNFTLFGHTLFQGGFIGVDIFFVISGYLITTLILKEIYKTNQFSFKYFYERRIRRILPVLLLVTIVTSIISYFILLPSSLIDFGKSVLSIISFISNFYFWLTEGKYGADSALLKPSLHTWSLSIEEQFYILFPIFLITTIKFFEKYLLAVLFLCFLISLFLSEYFSRFHPSFNFYMILSRSFEFIIGSLLSYFELNNKNNGWRKGQRDKAVEVGSNRKSYSILNQICITLGIILIFYSLLFYNFNKVFHPSFTTLIPLIGVSLIIWFSKKRELITEILSSKILVFFGLISYSLYLWHYPIFAYLRYLDVFNNSVWIKLLAIVLTIILSILSYYFIEKPFRNKNIISTKTLLVYSLICVIFLLVWSCYILKTEGIKSRFSNIFTEPIKYNENEIKLNRTGTKLNNVLLIGDSHARVIQYHLNKELTKLSYNLYYENTDLYLDNFNHIMKKNYAIKENFTKSNQKIDNFLENYENSIVIWKQRWSIKLLEEFFNNEEGYSEYQTEKERYTGDYFELIDSNSKNLEERQKNTSAGIQSSAKKILDNNNILIIVYPVPELGFSPLNLIFINYSNSFDKFKSKNAKIPILSVSYEVYKKRNKMIFEVLDGIEGPNVYRIYPDKLFCNTTIKNRCVVNDINNIFYFDNNHLSLKGSEYLVNNIIKVFSKLEVDKK